MEIEIGDWIRSKDGFIGKVRRITYDDMEKSNYYICEKDNVMASNYLENIAKHSKIISEIVEVGDYVNGHLVVEISKNVYNQKLVITEVDGKDGAIRHHYLERSIKNVVTHEQFANVEYKVEE